MQAPLSVDGFPNVKNWLKDAQVEFVAHLDDNTLIVERSPTFETPMLRVIFVTTFDCIRDTSGTYDDFDTTFEYQVENLLATIDISMMGEIFITDWLINIYVDIFKTLQLLDEVHTNEVPADEVATDEVPTDEVQPDEL